MGTEKFCLRWNDFESNISTAFRELREDKDFFDVTLACEDEQIQAHKVILSACSPFFRTVLRRNPHQHPLLYLKGVKFSDLQSVLNFMYHGEVNVAQEELNSFLAVAEELRVKGLTQNNSQSGSSSHQQPPSKPPTLLKPPSQPRPTPRPPPQQSDPVPPPKRPRPAPIEDDDIQEVVPVKSEPVQYQAAETSHALAPQEGELQQYGEGEYEDYGQYEGDDGGYEGAMVGMDGTKAWSADHGEVDEKIESLMGRVLEGGYVCHACGYSNAIRTDMKKHCETHIETPGYPCIYCQKHFKTRNSLNKHTSTKHREEKKKSAGL